MWISFAPESRLIIDFVLGPRKQYVADEFIEATDKHLSDSKPLFVSDGLKFHAEVLLKKYAQVVKNRKGKRLQKVEKRVIFGQNIDQSKISTSLLERQNLTFRQDNNRVSRKTIGFSKKIRFLYNQMRFCCTHFNFCRDHMGLNKERKMEVLRKIHLQKNME